MVFHHPYAALPGRVDNPVGEAQGRVWGDRLWRNRLWRAPGNPGNPEGLAVQALVGVVGEIDDPIVHQCRRAAVLVYSIADVEALRRHVFAAGDACATGGYLPHQHISAAL